MYTIEQIRKAGTDVMLALIVEEIIEKLIELYGSGNSQNSGKPIVSGSLPPMTEQELFEIYKAGMDNIDADGCPIDEPAKDFKETLNIILSRRQ